jgi:hypothetical protein
VPSRYLPPRNAGNAVLVHTSSSTPHSLAASPYLNLHPNLRGQLHSLNTAFDHWSKFVHFFFPAEPTDRQILGFYLLEVGYDWRCPHTVCNFRYNSMQLRTVAHFLSIDETVQQTTWYEGVSRSFRTKSITKSTTSTINTRWEATKRILAVKLTRLIQKLAIQLHLVAESCTICSSLSTRPVRKPLDTPSYVSSF